MEKRCRQCGASFAIEADDLAFYDSVSPVFAGQKQAIPPPTLCPDCRQQRRWAFQNQRFLYHRPSDATKKEIISVYSPEKPFTVYEKAEWLKVDNDRFSREYDFGRPFFAQFGELFAQTIKESISQTGEMVNSDYMHFGGWHKNCYLIFDAGKCEDCMYGTFIGYCKSCMDVLDMQRNELCYDCVDLNDCYDMLHATFCRNCSSSAYLFDCIGCKNCIGCVNLRNKQYYAFNEPVGKERFEALWKKAFDGSWATQQAMEKKWRAFALTQPRRPVHNVNSPRSTGDYLTNCDHAVQCYKCLEARDCKHCQYVVWRVNDCHDVSCFGESMEFCYELSASGGVYGKITENGCCFNAYMYYGGNSVFYSINVHENCKNIFGCCDVRAKRYCILNKQYTQGDYEALVPRIVEHMRASGEWGEFFPMTLSPFCYNETLALNYYPLTREEAAARGLRWKEADPKQYLPATCVPEDDIRNVSDAMVKELLACERCRKNYRVIARELAFYRDKGLPVPRLCTDCRYLERVARRNPQKLWTRTCGECGAEIQTTYAPDRPEIVYCESCHLASVN